MANDNFRKKMFLLFFKELIAWCVLASGLALLAYLLAVMLVPLPAST